MLKDDPTLEDALDGLNHATRYAEEIGEDEISRICARLYQELGEAAPDDHWTETEYSEEIHTDHD